VSTLHPRFATFGEMIRSQAARLGGKIALRMGERETSYAEVLALSERIARGLLARAIGPGDRVGWLGRNSDLYYPLMLGAARVGAIMVPINWRLADPEIDWILDDARMRLLFLGSEREDQARRLRGAASGLEDCIVADGADPATSLAAFLAEAPADAPLPEEDPEATALQIYTSGTTGHPKGARLSQRSLLWYRTLPPEEQPGWNLWSEDDVSLIAMPQFHIGGSGFGLQTLCAGATGIVVREFDAGEVLRFIDRARLSKIFIVPAALQMLQRHPDAPSVDYSRIRTIVYGASPIPLSQLREAMALFRCGFVQQYGMTESGGTICALPPEDHDPKGNARMHSAGRAMPWCEIVILDEAGRRLEAGMPGEIALRGPTMMQGYWNRPEETASAFTADGWFRTGDAGYLDADGYLYISDRVKDMIVTGGENVYPAEVEKALCNHPAVIEAAVIGVPDERWGEAIHAVVVPRGGDALSAEELRGWLRDHIAGFKIPRSIEFSEGLPRNASGKILRRELREPHWRDRSRAAI